MPVPATAVGSWPACGWLPASNASPAARYLAALVIVPAGSSLVVMRFFCPRAQVGLFVGLPHTQQRALPSSSPAACRRYIPPPSPAALRPLTNAPLDPAPC